METKAQKAAVASIINKISTGMWNCTHSSSLHDCMKSIEEYNLEKGALNEIYEALMKKGYCDNAAVLAKKYGL